MFSLIGSLNGVNEEDEIERRKDKKKEKRYYLHLLNCIKSWRK